MRKDGHMDGEQSPRFVDVVRKKEGKRKKEKLEMGNGERRAESWRESLIRKKKTADIFWSALDKKVVGLLDALKSPDEEAELARVNLEAESLYDGLAEIKNGKGVSKEELKSWDAKLRNFESKADELNKTFLKIQDSALRKAVETRKPSLPLKPDDIEHLYRAAIGPDARDEARESGDDKKSRRESSEFQSKHVPNEDVSKLSEAEEVDEDLLRVHEKDAERILALIGKPTSQNEQDEDEKENPNLGLTKLAAKAENLGKIWREIKVEVAFALGYKIPERQVISRLEKFNTVLNEMVGKAVPGAKKNGSGEKTYDEIEKGAEEKRRKNFRFLALRVRQHVDVSEGELYQAVVRKIMKHFFPLYEDVDADISKARDEIKVFDVSEFIGHKSERADGGVDDATREDEAVAGGESLEELKMAEHAKQQEFELMTQGKELADAVFKSEPRITLRSAKEKLNNVLEAGWGKVWEKKPNVYRAIIAYLREKLDKSAEAVVGQDILKTGGSFGGEPEKRKEKIEKDIADGLSMFSGLPDPFDTETADGNPDFKQKEKSVDLAISKLQLKLLKGDLNRAEKREVLQMIVDELLTRREVLAAARIRGQLAKAHGVDVILFPEKLEKAAEELERMGRAGKQPPPANQVGKSDYNWALMLLSKK